MLVHTKKQNTDVSLALEFQKHLSYSSLKHDISYHWKNKKKSSKKIEYHVKHNKDVDNQDMKMYWATNQFSELQFLGSYNKPYGVCGLVNHYRDCFVTKLGHGKCTICLIPFSFTPITFILEQSCVPGILAQKQPRYQPSQILHILSCVRLFS